MKDRLLVASQVGDSGEPGPESIRHLMVAGVDSPAIDDKRSIGIGRQAARHPDAIDVPAEPGHHRQPAAGLPAILGIQADKVPPLERVYVITVTLLRAPVAGDLVGIAGVRVQGWVGVAQNRVQWGAGW